MSFSANIVAAVLLSLSSLAKAEDEVKFIAFMQGEITVGADGRAKAVSFHGMENAKFEKYFTETMKSWGFHPVLLNGNPVDATTNFSFEVTATYSADKTLKHLEFENIAFRESAIETEFKKSHGLAPRKPGMRCQLQYPINALRSGAGGKLRVAVDIGQDGKVKDAAVTSASITNTHPRDAKVFAKEFSASAVRCYREYELTEAESVAWGCQNGCILSVQASFLPSKLVGKWQNYHNVPIAPAPWTNNASKPKDVAESEQSQLVRLKEDPTGKPIEIGG